MVEAPAVQGFNLAPQSGHVGVCTNKTVGNSGAIRTRRGGAIRMVETKRKCSNKTVGNVGVEAKYECRKKENLFILRKLKNSNLLLRSNY